MLSRCCAVRHPRGNCGGFFAQQCEGHGNESGLEFHASVLDNTLLEDTGDLSSDKPLDDDLDGEEGLSVEPDENDPHSVDWLDEDNVILRDIPDE